MIGKNLTWFFDPKPATDEDITAIENTVGHRFPDDYREFAKHYSGGSPNERDFEFPDDVAGTFYASASEFFSLRLNDDGNLLSQMEQTEFLPSDLIPFARDGGGNYICLDLRSGSTRPPVVFWHNGRRGLGDEISFVAKSFSDFVELLHEPEDDAA